jgi:hypothetical protein
MEYHYTKDILHVKEFLGHKEIEGVEEHKKRGNSV